MKKYTLALFVFAFVLLSFNINTKSASAYDSGCIGAAFNSTTGAPCDLIPDTTPASILPGCTSYDGFSATTGSPCNGSPNIIYSYEPVCSSAQGYSTTTGLCNTFRRMNPTLISGCTSTQGRSATTGEFCGKTPTYPSGCFSYSGWSSTTGLACDGTDQPTYPSAYITSTIPAAPLVITPAPVYIPPSAFPTSSCTITNTLRIGSTGNDVACLQSRMGLISDGKFGPRTQMAVRAFQTKMKLKADGVFGHMSIAALKVGN